MPEPDLPTHPPGPPEDGQGGWALVRLWLLSSAWGIALGAAFTAALLWLDVGGIGGLIARADLGFLPIFMLWAPLAGLFGAVDFARRVMAIGTQPPD